MRSRGHPLPARQSASLNSFSKPTRWPPFRSLKRSKFSNTLLSRCCVANLVQKHTSFPVRLGIYRKNADHGSFHWLQLGWCPTSKTLVVIPFCVYSNCQDPESLIRGAFLVCHTFFPRFCWHNKSLIPKTGNRAGREPD